MEPNEQAEVDEIQKRLDAAIRARLNVFNKRQLLRELAISSEEGRKACAAAIAKTLAAETALNREIADLWPKLDAAKIRAIWP